jgi:hypothetical protein
MGIYGYIRFITLVLDAIHSFRSFITTISLLLCLYSAILCLTAAFDVKKIIIQVLVICNLLFSFSFWFEAKHLFISFTHGILLWIILLIGILYDQC